MYKAPSHEGSDAGRKPTLIKSIESEIKLKINNGNMKQSDEIQNLYYIVVPLLSNLLIRGLYYCSMRNHTFLLF